MTTSSVSRLNNEYKKVQKKTNFDNLYSINEGLYRCHYLPVLLSVHGFFLSLIITQTPIKQRHTFLYYYIYIFCSTPPHPNMFISLFKASFSHSFIPFVLFVYKHTLSNKFNLCKIFITHFTFKR